jgi:DNA topoisomerase IB
LARLKRVDCAGPGIRRRRRGKGFEYVDEDGKPVRDEAVRARIAELAIPPAWEEVWICPDAMGHIQATGVDAAGRKQYLYHERWRARRDRDKFDAMRDFARALPKLRRRVARDLSRPEPDRDRVLAAAVRLLDRGFFRIGGEDYADENKTYGVATLRKRHVSVEGESVTFDYEAKGGARRVQQIDDPQVAKLARSLLRRRGGNREFLAFKSDGEWVDVKSADVNDYLKRVTGGEFSAKDFRTWNATVLASVMLASWVIEGDGEPASAAARERAKKEAAKSVAGFLGNTPAVCRRSYIDPLVFDRFDEERTIERAVAAASGTRGAKAQEKVERAVLRLLASG